MCPPQSEASTSYCIWKEHEGPRQEQPPHGGADHGGLPGGGWGGRRRLSAQFRHGAVRNTQRPPQTGGRSFFPLKNRLVRYILEVLFCEGQMKLNNFLLLKGTVRRKLRWVKSGINQQLFDFHLATYVFFQIESHTILLNSIKPVSAGKGIVN